MKKDINICFLFSDVFSFFSKRKRIDIFLVEDLYFNEMPIDLISYSFETWISALVGAGLVGCIGLLPIFIVPNEETKSIFIFLISIK